MTTKHALGTRVKIHNLNRDGASSKFSGQKGTVVEALGGDYLIWLDAQGQAFSFYESEFDAHVAPEVLRITSADHLVGFKLAFGLKDDWHSTVNQGITAQIRGTNFDNTGYWGTDSSEGRASEEFHVVFLRDGDEVAMINLANLCSWATGYRG